VYTVTAAYSERESTVTSAYSGRESIVTEAYSGRESSNVESGVLLYDRFCFVTTKSTHQFVNLS